MAKLQDLTDKQLVKTLHVAKDFDLDTSDIFKEMGRRVAIEYMETYKPECDCYGCATMRHKCSNAKVD